MLYFSALVLVPYLCFVFFGEGLNPFRKPRVPAHRSQWRRGRIMALASLIGTSSALVMYQTIDDSQLLAIPAGILIAVVFAVAFSAKRIAEFFWRQST